MGIPDHLTSWEICMKLRKQQLELDMEQQIGSKLGKEYIKTVYWYPAYLTYIQIISWEMLDWKKRWQENKKELYNKDLHDPDNHDGVIIHLEAES